VGCENHGGEEGGRSREVRGGKHRSSGLTRQLSSLSESDEERGSEEAEEVGRGENNGGVWRWGRKGAMRSTHRERAFGAV
jgi:hypothetical protein